MPQMDWFFMNLFLSLLERSWVGHFWDFILKFPKNFTSTIFPHTIQRGPFYACKNALIFVSFFWSKIVIIQLQMHKYGKHFYQWPFFLRLDIADFLVVSCPRLGTPFLAIFKFHLSSSLDYSVCQIPQTNCNYIAKCIVKGIFFHLHIECRAVFWEKRERKCFHRMFK